MKCRNCGTDIADKALICYRCGTATAEAKFKPAQIRDKRSPSRIVIAAIIIVVLVLLAFFLLNSGRPLLNGGRGPAPSPALEVLTALNNIITSDPCACI